MSDSDFVDTPHPLYLRSVLLSISIEAPPDATEDDTEFHVRLSKLFQTVLAQVTDDELLVLWRHTKSLS